MEVFAVLGLILATILTGAIASKRGRNPFLWGVLGFLCAIIALPLVLLLPPVGKEAKRTCPACKEKINAAAMICPHCRTAQI